MLDSLRELEAVARIPALPKILSVMTRTTGLRLAALARVTDERWLACAVEDHLGSSIIRGTEVTAKGTLCYETLQCGRSIAINDISNHPDYHDHPRLNHHGARSIISVPVILPNGVVFGTLTGFDSEVRVLDSPEILGSIELLGELIAFHLSAELELLDSKEMLATERQVAELREQFIAVLGHDLRNPLASVAAGARMLERRPDRAAEIAGHMNDSIQRMTGLIDEVLDFARGRLGGGLGMDLVPDVSISNAIEQVVHELQSARPTSIIDVDLQIDQAIHCDISRIGQLLSNLLGNALTHGADDLPVRVRGRVERETLELSVINSGNPIPEQSLAKLFEPFVRPASSGHKQGLGLGLYIASEIAKGHGGSLEVKSDSDGTCFTFQMPVSRACAGLPALSPPLQRHA